MHQWTGYVMALLALAALAWPGAAEWNTFNGSPAATGVAAEEIQPPLQLRWRFPAVQGFYFTPAVVNDRVYVGCLDYNVYAIDARTGEAVWVYHTGGPVFSGPSVDQGTVYVGSSDMTLYALDAQTGRPRWKQGVEGQIYCPPLVYQGVVCIGTFEGTTLHAFDAQTGQPKWTFEMGQRLGSAMAAGEGTIFAGSYDRNLYALDPANGALKWQFRTHGLVDSCPAVKNGVVYVKTPDDSVYALYARTGEVKWKYDSGRPEEDATQISNWSPLAVTDELVYFGSNDHNLYALDARTGKFAWVYEADDEVGASPTISGRVAYFGTKSGTLYALEAQTGELLWRRQPEEPAANLLFPRGIMWPPAIAEGGVFVCASIAANRGYVYAFDGLGGGGLPGQAGGEEPEQEKGGNIFGEIEGADK
jgi:outer membrane protein assembly factor BamB